MVKNGNMWGTLFLGGQPAGTQQGDFCVTWKGGWGVRWITGDTVPLHFRNPITVLGGVREGGWCQCRTMQGRERRREGPVTLLSSNAPPPPTASWLCRTSAQNISFLDDHILHQGVMEFKEFDLDIVYCLVDNPNQLLFNLN